MGYARICLNGQFQLKKSILTSTPAAVIKLGIGSVELMPQYVGLPCPALARRAKSDLSWSSFSKDGSQSRYTIHNFRFVRFGKATSYLYLYVKVYSLDFLICQYSRADL